MTRRPMVPTLAWLAFVLSFTGACSRSALDQPVQGAPVNGANAGSNGASTAGAAGGASGAGTVDRDAPTGTAAGTRAEAGARAAGSAGQAPGATQRPDDAGAVDSASVVPQGSIVPELRGDWWLAAGTSECPARLRWYTFTADSQVVHRIVDRGGACPPAELEQRGGFWHSGGELQINLENAGDVSLRPVESGSVLDNMRIAIVRGATPGLPDAVHLDRSALLSRDARHFASTHRLLVNGTGPQRSDLRVEVNLELDRGLRDARPGDARLVHVLARVIEVVVAAPAPVTHEVELDYPAVVQRERGWLQLVASELVALDPDAAAAAWQRMLREAGAGAYPDTVLAQYDQRIYPAQRFAPDLPTVLISAHVARTGLTRAAETPPPSP